MQYEECNGRSAVFSWALKVNARLKMADFLLHSESKWTYLVWTLANQWIHYSRQNPIKEESTEINSGFVQNIFFSLFFHLFINFIFHADWSQRSLCNWKYNPTSLLFQKWCQNGGFSSFTLQAFFHPYLFSSFLFILNVWLIQYFIHINLSLSICRLSSLFLTLVFVIDGITLERVWNKNIFFTGSWFLWVSLFQHDHVSSSINYIRAKAIICKNVLCAQEQLLN